MNCPNEDLYKNNLGFSSKKKLKEENVENESIKNDETTISSSSSIIKEEKKIKKNSLNYSVLNYTINNNPIIDKKKYLSSIKEENDNDNDIQINQIKDNDNENFCLLEENKNKNKNIEEKEQIEIEDKIIDDIINKRKGKSKKKKIKKSKESIVHISDDEEEIINISSDEKDDKENNNNKKNGNGKKNNDSKINSKNKIDLKFLEKEENEIEKENDFKTYIQKANNEEEDYKIIYEFNKLPLKPKIKNIDLEAFDHNSIFKCISYCFFDKLELRFILKLNFIYLSDKCELYTNKNCNEKILTYFLKEKDIINEKNDNNEDNIEDNIKITVTLKRFKASKECYTIIGREKKVINKKDKLNGFDELKFEEKEDLVNYLNFHKIFYILSIQKNMTMISKKTLPIKKLGIQNEGNTCYMNSIIQSIYNIPFLLKNIMLINIESNALSRKETKKYKNIISSLQNIFYKLYKYRTSVKITEIFFAFEWNKSFWNSPQDAEEIYMQIYEIISLYNIKIKENCEGILENTIEVNEINYKSKREEKFFFLQLDIENNHSLEECLLNFFKSEELTGDNKYQYIDNLNNTKFYDAIKFYKFKKIPNLLFIQLKRFQYDLQTNIFNKKNNGISFKEEIDLSDYLYNNDNEKIKNEYVLYCVIVHSGSAESGHYFCFVKDFKYNCYIKFNDTSVYLAEKKEVFNEIYGGEEIEYIIKNVTNNNKDSPRYEVKNKIKEISKNAYIFIYVKKNKINDIFNYDDNIKEIFEKYSIKKKKEEEIIQKLENNNNKTIDEFVYNKTFKNYRAASRQSIIPSNNKYNLLKQQNIKFKKKSSINMNEDMNTNLNFEDLLKQMDNANKDIITNENVYNNKNTISKKKRNMADYKKEKDNNRIYNNYYNNNDIIKDKIPKMEYTPNSFNEINNYFYLIDINDLSNKIKGRFITEYNKKIKVKDVPEIIEKELKLGYQKSKIDILKNIVNSTGYKLALVNSFGYFIKFLEDENEDITQLLKFNNYNNNNYNKYILLKHLCLYNLNINKEKRIKNVISINFISNNILNLIISKINDVFENYNYEQIYPPFFLIDENFNSLEKLNERITDIYYKYIRKFTERNNKKFKIYYIKESDILNLSVLRMNYNELSSDFFFMYIADINNEKTEYQRLIVGF